MINEGVFANAHDMHYRPQLAEMPRQYQSRPNDLLGTRRALKTLIRVDSQNLLQGKVTRLRIRKACVHCRLTLYYVIDQCSD